MSANILEIQIGEHVYLIGQLPVKQALKLGGALLASGSPLVGLLTDKGGSAALGIDAFDPLVDRLVSELSKVSAVRYADREPQLDKVLDAHFGQHRAEFVDWLIAAAKHSLADFFGSSALAPVARLLGELSASPTAATG